MEMGWAVVFIETYITVGLVGGFLALRARIYRLGISFLAAGIGIPAAALFYVVLSAQ